MNEKPRRLISPHYFSPINTIIILILLMIILHFIFPIQMILGFPLTLIGLGPVIVGLFIADQAIRTLKKNRTTVDFFEDPRNLVTQGVFQFSRNQMYLSGIFLGLGLAILLGSLVSFVFPVIMFLLLHFLYIPSEETQLKTVFGEEYLDYMKRVRKWI